MRISDWSSDVCSSDLAAPVDPRRVQVAFRSYDPTFYIAVEPALEDPVTFAGSPPASCRAVIDESDPPETLPLSETDFSDPAAGAGPCAPFATTLPLARPPGAPGPCTSRQPSHASLGKPVR